MIKDEANTVAATDFTSAKLTEVYYLSNFARYHAGQIVRLELNFNQTGQLSKTRWQRAWQFIRTDGKWPQLTKVKEWYRYGPRKTVVIQRKHLELRQISNLTRQGAANVIPVKN